MEKRASEYIRKLNDKGWVINEHMVEQFVIFARSECTRAVANVKSEIKKQVDLVDYRETK
jgi:hypothetical protein